LQHFTDAKDMDGENPAVHLNLGIALKLKGDHSGAPAALGQSLKLDPKGPFAHEAEGWLKTLTTAIVVAS
ncbi:MAG: hypothetical protein ACO1OB_01765, partial [Archangium sp.]